MFTNRLAHESSPYLRQHAHNPVDWFPWGEEALRRAKELNRPIFLSIGYSACHWCHVMEHESFEDPAMGQLLNEHFVSIKVDREERPDLDQIYMTAVQLLTKQGGWPMSMFLTPDLHPFYGGTYFPPEDRHGRPSFRRVLEAILQAWQDRRQALEEQARDLTSAVRQAMRLEPAPGALGPQLLQAAAQALGRSFDPRHGGFGHAPKFPHPMELRLLLRLWRRFGDEQALHMAVHTLDHMARGGMYDQLGGGFHRYSTDAHWLVPHFEKMLYDNALLTVAYLEAYQATGNSFFREVVEETLGYVTREMTSPQGAFFSTQDADSEGEEGKFFVWTRQEIDGVLGKNEAELFAAVYDVSAGGNWEGHNIPHRARSYEQDAKLLRLPEPALRQRLRTSKEKLLAVRSQRVWPAQDDKILTSWNALMISAYASAGQVLGRSDWAAAATRAADFLWNTMRRPDGRLFRTTSPTSPPKLEAYLEDYAYLLDAQISLYETTFDLVQLQRAVALAETMIDQFWDPVEGGFFFTGKQHEQLIARTKDPHDNAIPSGNSIAVTALLRLAKLTGRREFLEKGERTLQLYRGLLESSPMAAGQMLMALDFHLGPVQEFALVGDPTQEPTQQALGWIHRTFRPRKVIALKKPGVEAKADELVPWLQGKESRGDVTTYICENHACAAPVIGVDGLAKALTILPRL